MWLRLLRTVSFLGLMAAYFGALFLCWSMPRLVMGLKEDDFWTVIPKVNVWQVMLFSAPTLIVGAVAWAIAWWFLLRDSPDERTAPAPQAYLAFFTILGVLFTALITWRELLICGELSTVQSRKEAEEIVAGLIGGIFAILISVCLLSYHGKLWRSYRRYFRQSR